MPISGFSFSLLFLPGILKTGLCFCFRQRYHYRHNHDSWHGEKHLCFTICDAHPFHGIIVSQYPQVCTFARTASCFLHLGKPRVVEPLIKKLDDKSKDVRKTALNALAVICEDDINQELLTKNLCGYFNWLDPHALIDEERVKYTAGKLGISEDETSHRLEELADKYKLKLSWKGRNRKVRKGRKATYKEI